jgi:hypothetical protein
LHFVEADDYPDGPLTADEEEALEELDNMNGIQAEDEDIQEVDYQSTQGVQS